ncbi:MAG: response regulator [bacterium]|nr:response regulator [bacterium]
MESNHIRLVLVEDSEDDALLIVHELETEGFSVDSCRVQTAVDLEKVLRQDTWSVALVDYQMPQFSGLEAIRIIRELDPNLPLIIVSGKIGEEVAVAAMRAGAHDYVMKNNLARLAPAIRRELADASVRAAKRAAEEALRASEARYRAIVEDQTELVCRWQPNGCLTFANHAFCDYFGATPGELEGSDFLERVADEDRPGLLRKIQRLTVKYPVATGEHRVHMRDSSLAWHEWTDRGSFDAKGNLVALQSVGRDITERRKVAETERQRLLLVEVLRDTAAALNSTLELDGVLDRILANVGWVIPHDASVIFTVASGKARLLRMQGWTDQGVEDLPDNVALSALELSTLAKMAESGRPIVIQNTADNPLWRTGSRRLAWVRSFVAAPLFDEEKAIGVMALCCARENYFTDNHLEMLEGFASQAASAARNAKLFDTVSRSQDELRRLSHRIVSVLEDERGRISRELHDEIGQLLTALIINADFVAGSLASSGNDKVLHRLREISNLARQTMEQVRGLSMRLRPAMLDELGLESTLRWLTSSFSERTGIEVDLQIVGMGSTRLGSNTETTLYRAVQEALTNVTRHAQADAVDITLRTVDFEIELLIRDNGIGFDMELPGYTDGEVPGLGLLGMRERVANLGGSIHLDSKPGEGTTLTVHVPANVPGAETDSE